MPARPGEPKTTMHYGLRRLLKTALALVLIAGLVVADRAGVFGRAPKGDWATYEGRTFRVTHVVDGDTLDIDAPDGDNAYTRIRLWGVDTPEPGGRKAQPQHFSAEATKFTRKEAGGQNIRLELEPGRRTRDPYDRLLAFIYLPDGRMLNRLLVEEGCAYADPRYPHRRREEFLRLQRRARKAGRGLWKTVEPSDLPRYDQSKPKLPGG